MGLCRAADDYWRSRAARWASAPSQHQTTIPWCDPLFLLTARVFRFLTLITWHTDAQVEAADVLLWQNEPSVYDWRKAPSSRKASQVWAVAPYESPINAFNFGACFLITPFEIFFNFASLDLISRLTRTLKFGYKWMDYGYL